MSFPSLCSEPSYQPLCPSETSQFPENSLGECASFHVENSLSESPGGYSKLDTEVVCCRTAKEARTCVAEWLREQGHGGLEELYKQGSENAVLLWGRPGGGLL